MLLIDTYKEYPIYVEDIGNKSTIVALQEGEPCTICYTFKTTKDLKRFDILEEAQNAIDSHMKSIPGDLGYCYVYKSDSHFAILVADRILIDYMAFYDELKSTKPNSIKSVKNAINSVEKASKTLRRKWATE